MSLEESASRCVGNPRSLSRMDSFDSEPQRTATEEESPAVWGLGATLLWTLLIAFVFLVVQTIAAVAYAVGTMHDLSRVEAEAALRALTFDGLFLSICTFATLLVGVPLIVGIVKLKRGSKLKEYLALVAPRPRQVLAWSIIVVAFGVLTDFFLSLLRQPQVPEFMLRVYGSTHPRWLLWLAIIIAAPIFEEIAFRGFIFKGLAASRLRWYGATIITSVLWAGIHLQYDWYEISVIFALGLVLGTARAMTNSTLLTMWLHCLVNLFATIQMAMLLK
jgi:membrane protease YdiL (CAAX protease family)